MKDLVLIYNARAGYIDLGHHDFFRQTVVRQKTRNSSELNSEIPHPRDIKNVDSFHTFKGGY